MASTWVPWPVDFLWPPWLAVPVDPESQRCQGINASPTPQEQPSLSLPMPDGSRCVSTPAPLPLGGRTLRYALPWLSEVSGRMELQLPRQ